MSTLCLKIYGANTIPVAPAPLPLGLVLVVLWLTVGGNFTAFGLAISALPPIGMIAVRFLIAGPLMIVGLMALTGARPTAISSRQLGNTALSGVLLLGLGQTSIVWSIQDLPPAVAALLMGAAPLWIVILSAVLFRQMPRRTSMLGVFIGFAGLAGLFGAPGNDIPLIPALIALLGAIAWAVGSLFGQRADLPANAALGAAIQMTFAGSLLLVVSWTIGEAPVAALMAADARVWGAMAYLVFGGSMVAFGSFIWIVQNASATLANTSSYVGPVVAAVIGWLFVGDQLSLAEIAASVTALVGVALIVSGKR